MRYAHAIVVSLALLGLLLAFLAGCGPVRRPPPEPSFFLIFHNESSSTQKVVVTYWCSDFSVSSSSPVAVVTSHTKQFFRFDTLTPDLVDVKAGWGTRLVVGARDQGQGEGHERRVPKWIDLVGVLRP